MKVLVTGASGRIGRAIADHLGDRHQVVGLDRVTSPRLTHQGDLGDAALLARALQGVDAVVHSAALHAPHVGVVADAEFERVNVQATALLWRLALAAGVQRFVFTSTTALYGLAATPQGRAGWVDEATPPQPRTVYHRSKLAAEAALTAAAAQAGTAGPVLRILRMSRCFPEPAPRMAVLRLHRGVDARDVAQAHALALADAGPPVSRYLLSGSTPFLPADVSGLWHDAPAVLRQRAPALVAQFAQRGWPLPARIDRVYDASLAARQLGWVPRHGPEEVLRQADAHSPEVLSPDHPAGH